MLLHRPAPDPAKLLAEATEEEKRKRANRLAKKNGQGLGSATYNPPTTGTSEQIQKSDPILVANEQAEEPNRETLTGVAEPTTEEASAKSAQGRGAVDADERLPLGH